MPLPVNIHDLLSGKFVESDRIEYKKGWNPGAIYRTICAFANDFNDIGGGYIVVGVEEKDGQPSWPPAGLSYNELEQIQKEMVGLNNLINPAYFPQASVEEIEGRKVLVIWVLSGPNRPYEVPEEIKAKDKKFSYYIRYNSTTVKVNKQQREELISLSNKVPFDDRPNTQFGVGEISLVLLKEHLRQVGSKMLEWVDNRPVDEILLAMQLLYGASENCYPRNIALMMFSEQPETYFPYTRVELVHFPKGTDDPEFFEAPYITGPVPKMIRQTLQYLRVNVLKEKVRKVKGRAEAARVWNFPYEALEEIIANALYHRDYQTREPVEVRIYPENIVVLNYGGPDRSIRIEALHKGNVYPRRYRNRRLGDFLKELGLTEGKATGIPAVKKAMKENGSPAPIFETDDERSYFQVTLPIHPWFQKTEEPASEALPSDNQVPLTARQEEIIRLIKEDNRVSQQAIAEHLGVNLSSVEGHFAALKKKGILQRHGGTRGYWKVELPDK